jgi:hypothetical protein
MSRMFPRFLVISATVSMVFTSALAVAQVPKAEPGGVTITTTIKTIQKRAPGEQRQQVDAPPPQAIAKPAAANMMRMRVRPINLENNLENLIQQYIGQARPIVRAELIFVRKVCELDMEHFRRINHNAEAAIKEAAKTFVEAQQQGRVGQQGRVRVQGGVRTSLVVDGLALLHDGLASVMKKELTAEQFAHYQVEVEKRDANRKKSAVRFLVDTIDRDLYLSGPQRLKLTESLLPHWEESWNMSLEHTLYGNQYYPMGIDAYVTPFLDATQKRIWQGAQKVGFGGFGFGGLQSGVVNDPDALELELGEERKAEPGKNAPIRRVEVRQAPVRKVETEEAVPTPTPKPK